MKKLSIVRKAYYTEEEVVGYYTTGDRMKKWGKMGAAWGGFWLRKHSRLRLTPVSNTTTIG